MSQTIESTLKVCNPTSPGRRGKKYLHNKGLHKGGPLASLVDGDHTRKYGRNNTGRITCRHRSAPTGTRNANKYRIIDFKRNKHAVPARVERIEYDPNRTAFIALLSYRDGEKRYIIAPEGLAIGQTVMSGPSAPITLGNSLPLFAIPQGSTLHAIEMKPGKGAQIARSAGGYVTLVSKDGDYVVLRLRSGELRKVRSECMATIGVVSNVKHNLIKLGTAGAKRRLGVRPTVRGVAMNPIDHPHGGGEGRTSGGRHPVSPWGWKTKGLKTRSCKRTDAMIVKRRSKKKGDR